MQVYLYLNPKGQQQLYFETKVWCPNSLSHCLKCIIRHTEMIEFKGL